MFGKFRANDSTGGLRHWIYVIRNGICGSVISVLGKLTSSVLN
jgi:hypothetical protein